MDHSRVAERTPSMHEAVRQACVRAAIDAFEDSRIRGLCCEGAWECALGAIKQLDLTRVMNITIKRVYDKPSKSDGTRVLVDRLWPRGLTREQAALGLWAKDLAPSPALRRWFEHDPDKCKIFARKYRQELQSRHDAIDRLLDQIDRRRRLTLLYAAKNPSVNHAVILKSYLEQYALE